MGGYGGGSMLEEAAMPQSIELLKKEMVPNDKILSNPDHSQGLPSARDL
jgi:hypothetical protein